MSEKDGYCCLLFDEMLIRENVCFNQKFDCTEGFKDLGSQGKTCNNANHALLFTVHGQHRKWKQPVAYYLSRGSTKAAMDTHLPHLVSINMRLSINDVSVVVNTIYHEGFSTWLNIFHIHALQNI